MTFYDRISEYRDFDFEHFFNSITESKIEKILGKERISELEFLSLLSGKAEQFIEPMAQKAARLTRKYFGSCIYIFTPLYISNHCDNVCAYCSFARQHTIERKHLSFEDIRKECEQIKAKGIRHILVLTGESPTMVNIEYLEKSISIIREYFSSVAVEVYALTEEEYARLIAAGMDSLTMYQETYNETAYAKYHNGGPKQDYRFRLETPDRACSQKVRSVTVAALFGLHDPATEAFFTGLHGSYLQHSYPDVEVSVSLPRLRPLVQKFDSPYLLDDRHFVQYMTAMRLFLPSAGITVSTRESGEFRNAILPLGVTKMSAGVSTSVGGHSKGELSSSQFEIADERSVDEMKKDLASFGFQAVMHNWNNAYVKEQPLPDK